MHICGGGQQAAGDGVHVCGGRTAGSRNQLVPCRDIICQGQLTCPRHWAYVHPGILTGPVRGAHSSQCLVAARCKTRLADLSTPAGTPCSNPSTSSGGLLAAGFSELAMTQLHKLNWQLSQPEAGSPGKRLFLQSFFCLAPLQGGSSIAFNATVYARHQIELLGKTCVPSLHNKSVYTAAKDSLGGGSAELTGCVVIESPPGGRLNMHVTGINHRPFGRVCASAAVPVCARFQRAPAPDCR